MMKQLAAAVRTIAMVVPGLVRDLAGLCVVCQERVDVSWINLVSRLNVGNRTGQILRYLFRT